ncbi:creatininase family protein [Roseisolibacter sp. H3M3-2]|uniref:creatininase family protein n=1 Tax=Roseisolibacter sp. H3M3-2 TaxID=3031323 RepID=UPI0023DC20FB|nr:creatininase family protein [Roseisolibacter sp. H3M3-2]MDF1502660.1 creatininase family protein [Roseisolibacter sp. H3M3-2]
MTDALPAARPRRLKEMWPQEVRAALDADPRLLVPVGACAPHGDHLPLGADTLIADRLADDLSRLSGVVRAPSVEYGVNAPHASPAAGSAGVRKKTLHRLLNDLLASWEACGVREFVLLTAHAHDPHQEALATVVTNVARVRVVDVFAVDVRDLLEGQDEPMHADEVDTSLLLHLAPELVRPEGALDYMVERATLRRFRQGHGRGALSATAVLGRPSMASAAKGKALYERIVGRIATRVLDVPPERLTAL